MRRLGLMAGCVLLVAVSVPCWAGDDAWDWSRWDARRKAAGHAAAKDVAPTGRVSGDTARHDPLLDEAGWDWSEWDAKRKARAARAANGTSAFSDPVYPSPLGPQSVPAASGEAVTAGGPAAETPADAAQPAAMGRDKPLNPGFALKSPPAKTSQTATAGVSGGSVREKTLDAETVLAAPAGVSAPATAPGSAFAPGAAREVSPPTVGPSGPAKEPRRKDSPIDAPLPALPEEKTIVPVQPAPASPPRAAKSAGKAVSASTPVPPAVATTAPIAGKQAGVLAQPQRIAAPFPQAATPNPVAVVPQAPAAAPQPAVAAPHPVSAAPQAVDAAPVRVAALAPAQRERNERDSAPQRYAVDEERHFLALALYARDDQIRDQSLRAPQARPKVVTKWRDDLRIQVAGAASPALRGMVREAVDDVNRVLGAVCGVRAAMADGKGNVSVFVFPRSPGGDLPGYATLRYGQGGVVQGAEVVLYAERMSRAVVLRELLRVLGMQGYDFETRDTVMRPDGDAAALPGPDRQALAILYRSEIAPGMNIDEVRRALAALTPQPLP